jgi:hypothetical protein
MVTLLRQLLAAILSFLLAVPAFSNSYNAPFASRMPLRNANDQLSTDTCHSDGNTTASNGLGYVYDFENHLLRANGITYVYDGDGNRFLKTIAGVPTQYVIDELNPTGKSGTDGMYSDICRTSFVWLVMIGSFRETFRLSPSPPKTRRPCCTHFRRLAAR